MINATPTTKSKICNKCITQLPLHRFDRKRSGSEDRRAVCRSCTSQDQREYRRKRQLAEFTTFAQQVHRRRNRPRVVEGVVAVMVQKFGGLNKFTEQWISIIKSGSSVAMRLRQCRAIGELIAVAEAQRQSVDVSDLSDDEIEREMQAAAAKAVAADPAAAVAGLEALGAKVTWPVDDKVRTRQVDG